MEDKRRKELEEIMSEEMSKAVKLDNVINLLAFEDVETHKDTIKYLEGVMEKHLKVYTKAFGELYEEGKRGRA